MFRVLYMIDCWYKGNIRCVVRESRDLTLSTLLHKRNMLRLLETGIRYLHENIKKIFGANLLNI